jgi:5-formaminoimidazole-4-carboxamide-1-beta-D-ribofuranosyl 5'-monophosphate synthetase
MEKGLSHHAKAAPSAWTRGNPNIDNIAKDFDRFGFDLRAEINADPANAIRQQHLATLNLSATWRIAGDVMVFRRELKRLAESGKRVMGF